MRSRSITIIIVISVIGIMIVLVLVSWGMVVMILMMGLVFALLQKCETMDERSDKVAVKGADGGTSFGGVGA